MDGVSLDRLTLAEVDELLSRNDLLKVDLIRIATERFAVSRSTLLRRNREAVVAAIRSAAENEGALGIIADAARNEGTRRS